MRSLLDGILGFGDGDIGSLESGFFYPLIPVIVVFWCFRRTTRIARCIVTIVHIIRSLHLDMSVFFVHFTTAFTLSSKAEYSTWWNTFQTTDREGLKARIMIQKSIPLIPIATRRVVYAPFLERHMHGTST